MSDNDIHSITNKKGKPAADPALLSPTVKESPLTIGPPSSRMSFYQSREVQPTLLWVLWVAQATKLLIGEVGIELPIKKRLGSVLFEIANKVA